MRRTRRSRVNKDKQVVLGHLVWMASNDERIVAALEEGNRKKAFGRLLHKWMDNTQESVIDRYVDEDAIELTSFALNIVNKELKENV